MYIKAIVLEDSVYIGGYYDTHMALLKQLNIQDAEKNRKTKFVKCWFKIDDRDIYNSINEIDGCTIKAFQDELPPWFNKENTLEKTKEAFKKWYGKHVFVDQEIKELSSGFYYLKNCKVECLSGDVKIELCDGCQIECVSGEVAIKDCFNSNINIMLDKASIWWIHNSKISEMFDEARVEGDENAVVNHAYENSQIHQNIKIAYDHRNKEES